MKNVELSCACGTVKGTLTAVKSAGFHVQCLCCDCQKFASYLGNEKAILDEHGGTELFQTYPEYLRITEGSDHIACVRLKEKGLYRWYANCCNMPLANTMASSKIPFVGISVKLMQFAKDVDKDDALGPISLKAFGQYAVGEMPPGTHPRFPMSYMSKILFFMIKGMLGKKHEPSPFFRNGKPLVGVRCLSKSSQEF